MTASELTYFDVIGHWYDVEAPATSSSANTPQFLVVSAFVTFTPRLKPGTVVYVANLDLDGGTTSANTALSIAPVTARILEGELEVINQADSSGVQLLANTAILGLTDLIYDVSFTQVEYAGATRVLSNFAFTAPTSATTVDLSDPTLTRLAYDPTNYS